MKNYIKAFLESLTVEDLDNWATVALLEHLFDKSLHN
jgi:hypothetical protein